MLRNALMQIPPSVLIAVSLIAIAFVVVAAKAGLNTAFVPTPQDESSRLEAAITKTADFDGTAYDHGSGFTPGGIGMPVAAVTKITALDATDTNETYKFVLQESADNVTYTDAGPIITVTAVGIVSIPGFISQRYNRLKLDVGGTTPSITYESWLNPLGTP